MNTPKEPRQRGRDKQKGRKVHDAEDVGLLVDLDSRPVETDMEAIAEMLVKHKEDLSSEFQACFSTLEKKLDRINTKVEDHERRVLSLESNASTITDRVVKLEELTASLAKDNVKLKQKTVDLEGRSRRNNVRILGLDESTRSDPDFLPGILVEVLGDKVLSSPPELERSHRVASSIDPRPIVACFHKFQTRDLVVREARKMRGKLNYRGAAIQIFEDHPAEVMEERKKYKEIMSELYKLGLKPALRYPARLFASTVPDGPKRQLTLQEANKLVSSTQRRSAEPAMVQDVHASGQD